MYYNHLQFKPHLASKRCEQYISRVGRGVCRVHLQTRIAAEPLQLQRGFLQLQAIFCNCSRALLGCNCGLQTHQIFRCICNGAAALQFLASANLQVLQLQVRTLREKGLFPPPPAANSQFGRASCTAHSYRALAAERGEAFARFGWWISISLCSAESLHGTSPVRPTQEGLITKSLHGTREKLLMPPAQVIVTALADGD